MIKQILSKEVEDYVKKNPKSVLIDVRTEEEWNIDGKPDAEKIALKTHYLTIQFADKTFNQNFIEDFKKLNIELTKPSPNLYNCALMHEPAIAIPNPIINLAGTVWGKI